jgi:hypothetical protein
MKAHSQTKGDIRVTSEIAVAARIFREVAVR